MNDMTAIVDQQTTADVSNVDVIYAHWDIYRKIEERFKQIFSFEPLSGMLLRLNNLRMDSSTDDPNNRWTRIESSYAPLFYQVDELSKRVVCGVFKGSFRVGADEVEAYKKDLHDMQMIL